MPLCSDRGMEAPRRSKSESPSQQHSPHLPSTKDAMLLLPLFPVHWTKLFTTLFIMPKSFEAAYITSSLRSDYEQMFCRLVPHAEFTPCAFLQTTSHWHHSPAASFQICVPLLASRKCSRPCFFALVFINPMMIQRHPTWAHFSNLPQRCRSLSQLQQSHMRNVSETPPPQMRMLCVRFSDPPLQFGAIRQPRSTGNCPITGSLPSMLTSYLDKKDPRKDLVE